MLSLGQVRMSLLQTYYSDRPIYNISFDVNVEGKLDYKLFEHALTLLSARHKVLRLNVAIENDKLVHRYNQHPVVLDTNISEEAFLSRPFDLGRDRLFKILAKDNRLLFLFSDIIIDGHTILNFFKDLQIIYQALRVNQLPKFPVMKAVKEVKPAVLEQGQGFWTKMLPKDLDLNLPLPVGINTDDYAEGRVKFGLPLDRIKKRIGRLGITLFDYLTAMYLRMLYRVTGKEDLCIDTICADHDEKQVGLFNEVVLLPYMATAGDTLDEYLVNYSKRLTEIKANIVPLEYLCSRLPFKSLCNVRIHFEYANKNTEKYFTFGDAKLSTNLYENASSQIRQLLTFNVCEYTDKIECYFAFKTACFPEGYIEQLKDYFISLLNDTPGELPPTLPERYVPKRDKRLIAYTHAGYYPDKLSYAKFAQEF